VEEINALMQGFRVALPRSPVADVRLALSWIIIACCQGLGGAERLAIWLPSPSRWRSSLAAHLPIILLSCIYGARSSAEPSLDPLQHSRRAWSVAIHLRGHPLRSWGGRERADAALPPRSFGALIAVIMITFLLARRAGLPSSSARRNSSRSYLLTFCAFVGMSAATPARPSPP